jgi:hypothetical protein
VATAPTDRPITRDDLEAKLRELSSDVQSTTSAAAPFALVVGAGALLVLVGVAYLLGRRRGHKRSTVVEIRRI